MLQNTWLENIKMFYQYLHNRRSRLSPFCKPLFQEHPLCRLDANCRNKCLQTVNRNKIHSFTKKFKVIQSECDHQELLQEQAQNKLQLPWRLLSPGTCMDSVICRMSLTNSRAKAEKTGSIPHSMAGGSSAGSIAAACISSWKQQQMFPVLLLLQGKLVSH